MRSLPLGGLTYGDFRRVQGLVAQDGVVEEAGLLFGGPVAGDDDAGDTGGYLHRRAYGNRSSNLHPQAHGKPSLGPPLNGRLFQQPRPWKLTSFILW